MLSTWIKITFARYFNDAVYHQPAMTIRKREVTRRMEAEAEDIIQLREGFFEKNYNWVSVR